ncbi:MAG: hypothetical protein H7A53_04340 [Akkermansiaceae bacterium]|nr:hypothetical protein [Akkermansiaceae bacterium]
MARPSRSSSSSSSSRYRSARVWRTVSLIALLAAAYWYEQKFGLPGAANREPEKPAAHAPLPAEPAKDSAATTPKPAASSKSLPDLVSSRPGKPAASVEVKTTKVNGYEKLEGCRLVDHRNNDGDSFFVRHGAREFELRLYFVDSAEKYLSDRYEDQRRRVAEQARDFGGIGIDQTVELGQMAKAHTLHLLEGKPFTVFTKWERVYDGERYYGFVQLPGAGGEFLSEDLVENGLVRIHTKGESTPEGQSYRQYRDHLEAMERAAKAAKRGAWGMRRP